MLLDDGISGDRNVIKKKDRNILKYEDLIIEIQRTWNVKNKSDTSNNGATGSISKSLRKHLSNIPGKKEIKDLQKTAILGTANILKGVLCRSTQCL